MTVNRFYTAGRTIESFNNALIDNGLNESVVELVKDCIIMNCDARIEMSSDAKYTPEGNGTEVGMLRFLQQNNIEVQDLLAKRHREGEHECSIPFGPVRKRQVEVIRPYKGCEYVRVVVKGAPEYVIQHCTSILNSDGEKDQFDEDERQRILD